MVRVSSLPLSYLYSPVMTVPSVRTPLEHLGLAPRTRAFPLSSHIDSINAGGGSHSGGVDGVAVSIQIQDNVLIGIQVRGGNSALTGSDVISSAAHGDGVRLHGSDSASDGGGQRNGPGSVSAGDVVLGGNQNDIVLLHLAVDGVKATVSLFRVMLAVLLPPM